MPNGITTSYDYDGMSRLTRLKDVNPTSTLFDRQYAYNTANQISQIADLTETKNFGYDNVDRLTSQTGSIFGNESYSFDSVRNRTASHRSATYGYQSNNRLTSTATATYGYDADGVMTSKTDGSTNWAYTWDFENRMTSADNGTGQVDYVYDALGRRVSRDDGTQLTNFTFDGQDVLMDDDSVTGVSTYQNGLGIDNKLKVSSLTASSYFLGNHLGSTNALTDASGSVTASNSFDSFGNATNASFPSRYQFTGRELDSFTGLQYNRARWYDPSIGRFISEDPIGLRGGINPFVYVHNNPANRLDAFGLNDDDDWAQQLWRAQQDELELLKRPIEFGYGFGDATTFGISKLVRSWEGLNDHNVECSSDYNAGWWTGVVTVTAIDLAGFYDSLGSLGFEGSVEENAAINTRGPGVYEGTPSEGPYIGQSKNMGARYNSYFNSSGKFSGQTPGTVKFYEMPGSTQLEREVYEQFRIDQADIRNLQNVRNPMGGRREQFRQMYDGVIQKYNLPR